MSKQNDELDRLAREGPVGEIFRAEQALSILDATGELANEINQNNYGEVFSTFQAFCIDQIILSINKLYENPGRYQLKSIPAVLRYFEENTQTLVITEPYLLQQQLTRLNLLLPDMDNDDQNTKNIFIHHKMINLVPDISNNETLAALKTLRDKRIAHPEDISVESLPRPTWGAVEDLLTPAKDIVGIIGDGYLSTAYMLEDGEYLLSTDASRVGRGTKRMLCNLGIKASNKSSNLSGAENAPPS